MPVRPNMMNALLDDRIDAIRNAHLEARITRAELDLSGGIDSAVMACLLVLTLGPENVTLVHSRFSTNQEQSERAHRLAEALTCPLVDASLGGMWNVLLTEMERSLEAAGYDMDEIKARQEADPTILGSIRSCLRAPIGRGFNRLTGGGLRHGTGNECEDRWLRFYQKGGDGEVDSNPIAMLSKGEVYQLAWWIAQRFPKYAPALLATIEATPSPDLWGTGDGHNDEDELLSWTGVPFTYSRIDTETGQYSHVGLIERVSRFLNAPHGTYNPPGTREVHDITVEDVLFMENLSQTSMRALVGKAGEHQAFQTSGPDFTPNDLLKTLRAARHAEKITRHKMNPNCPAYGTREGLLRKGILTDDLPVIG